MNNKPTPIELSATDQETLTSWLRSTCVTHGLALRVRIILKLADGEKPVNVHRALGVSEKTIYKWCKRWYEKGIDCLLDAPRSGRLTELETETVKTVLIMTCDEVPEEAAHWSVTLMTKHAGISTWQVQQSWANADFKKHRLRTFKISNDPDFADKVIDVVGLYMNPPYNALVHSVDEETQIKALDRTQPGLLLSGGRIVSRTHDYKPNGTASLYAAFDILIGEVIPKFTDQHRAREFIVFLNQLERRTPKEKTLHIILDNVSTHKMPEVQNWLKKHPRFESHFTPTSAFWLNAGEDWFAQQESRALYRGVFNSVKELKE